MPPELCFDFSELGSKHAARQFEKSGCIQVSNFLPAAKIDALSKSLAETVDSPDLTDRSIDVGPNRQMIALPVAGAFNDPDLYASTELKGFFSEALGQNFLLSCFTCVMASPSAPDQHVHQDLVGLFSSPLDSLTPSFAINLFVPLVPLNATNGTTRIWPYSHRKPDLRTDAHADDYVLPELETGSALLLDYRVKHGGTANISATNRPLLCLAYSRDWFLDTAHFNKVNPLQVERASLEKMSKEDRHLFSRAEIYRNLSLR